MATNRSSDRIPRRPHQPPPTAQRSETSHKSSASNRDPPNWSDDKWRPNNNAANWRIPDQKNSWHARGSSQNDDYAFGGNPKRPNFADCSTGKPQNDDNASSGKSKQGNSTGGQSRTSSQNDDYTSGGKSKRGDYSGRASQNDDNANSSKSKRGNYSNGHDSVHPRNAQHPSTNQRQNHMNNRSPNSTRERDKDWSLFSRYNNMKSYKTAFQLKKITFPGSYRELEHYSLFYTCFIEGSLPLNTPDKFLRLTLDVDTMTARNSSALKVHTQILHIRDNCLPKTKKQNDLPSMFPQSDTDSDSATSAAKSQPKKKSKSKRPFNDFKKHEPSNKVLSVSKDYTKRFLMSLPHCLPLHMGFHRLQNSSRAYCPLQFCLRGWREEYGLCTRESDQLNECSLGDCGKTSNGIIHHIRSFAKKNEPLHELVLLYVEEHYGYMSTNGYMNSKVGHKALYPVNSTEFRAASKFEIEINAIEDFKLKERQKIIIPEDGPAVPHFHSHPNEDTASSDNITDPLPKTQATSEAAIVSVTASAPTKHIPSTISLPSLQDISTVTKVTNTALSELTLEELRSQFTIVSNRWKKNQHVTKKALKQRKRRKLAKETKKLLNEATISPMVDTELTVTDAHSALTVPPITSYDPEGKYNDLDDRKRMLQLRIEIDERENKKRQEILDLELVSQKTQEKKRKLQNEVEKNTFIDLIDDSNVMSDDEMSEIKENPSSRSSGCVLVDSDDDNDEDDDDDNDEDDDPNGEDSDGDFQTYTLNSVPDDPNTANTKMTSLSIDTPKYNCNTLIIGPVKSSRFRKYVLEQDHETTITSKGLQNMFPLSSMQTKFDTLRLIGLKNKYPTLKFKAVSLENFLNGNSVNLITKKKEVYHTVYFDHYSRLEKNHCDATGSERFLKEVNRMILSHSLVPNTKQPYGMSNGWKLFLPYSEKMMCMIRDEKVLMQGVDISFLTVRTLEGNGHLLWNVASDKETNSLIKKNGYEHVDRNIIIKERRPSLRSFENLLIDSGCKVKKAETLRKVVGKVNQILFIKLLGPHQPIHRFIDGKSIVDKSYPIDTKN